ncbi:seven-hairpin glycosidase [Wallemia mellicola]|uniref:alpha-1,2-Mannosidase n=1 Tax=Wallemia mellicola TaxID=1708541 RepID=A0A4T0TPY0_9BASI|nr:seven-hairpin glycosidase [Wallemia mellicola]
MSIFRLKLRARVVQTTIVIVLLIVLGYFSILNKKDTEKNSRRIPEKTDSIRAFDKLPYDSLDQHWTIFRSRNPPIAINQLEDTPLTYQKLNVTENFPVPSDFKPKESPVYEHDTLSHDDNSTSLNLHSLLYKSIAPLQYKFGGQDNNDETKYRQQIIQNAFLHAWNSYKRNAYGFDEIHPLTGKPFNSYPKKYQKSPFNGWGATIVDNLDTLLIMGLQDEYEEAREHVNRIDFNYVHSPSGELPTFETNIRYLGGLLSAYDLSGDPLMISRAIELGDILMNAYNTTSHIPSSVLKPNYPPNEEDYTILAESGSMILEFTRLSIITGDYKYFNVAHKAQSVLFGLKSTIAGLLPTHVRLDKEISQTPRSGVFTLGALSDSYYEYLIKLYRLVNTQLTQYSQHYVKAIDSLKEYLILDVPSNIESFEDITVSGEVTSLTLAQHENEGGKILPKWEHLACFSGGMFGLGAKILNRPDDLMLADKLASGCFDMANNTITGLAPESAIFDLSERASNVVHRKPPEKHRPFRYRSMSSIHLGRPEIIESLFVMYRITGDAKWREKAWRMFTSWVSACISLRLYLTTLQARHTYAPHGFSAIENVETERVYKVDNMESFVLAETLKYYYLIFSDQGVISLDDYVLSTEAHPFRLSKSMPEKTFDFPELTSIRGEGTDVQKYLKYLDQTRPKKEDFFKSFL